MKLTRNLFIKSISISFSLDIENNQCVLAGNMLGLVLCLSDCPPIIFIPSLTLRGSTHSASVPIFVMIYLFPHYPHSWNTVFLKVSTDLQTGKSSYSPVFLVRWRWARSGVAAPSWPLTLLPPLVRVVTAGGADGVPGPPGIYLKPNTTLRSRRYCDYHHHFTCRERRSVVREICLT